MLCLAITMHLVRPAWSNLNNPSAVRFYFSTLFLIRSTGKGGQEQTVSTNPCRHNGQLLPSGSSMPRKIVAHVTVLRLKGLKWLAGALLLDHPSHTLITYALAIPANPRSILYTKFPINSNTNSATKKNSQKLFYW